MIINEISLKDFRSHAETTLTLDKLTVIRGTNASGKSSIEQALELAEAGRCEGTTADGKGSRGLIRAGAKKGSIKLTLEMEPGSGDQRVLECALKGTEIHRILTDPKNPAWTGGTSALGMFKANRDVLACLINNRRFVDQDEDNQKEILASIVLPKTYEWPAEVISDANSLGIQIAWEKLPVDVIKEGYDLSFKARTNINRDVKNFQMPSGDVSEADEFEELQERLKTRRQELEAAVSANSASSTKAQQDAQVRTLATTRRDEAQARITREEAGIATIEERILSPTKLKEAQKVAKGAAKAKELDAKILTLAAELNVDKESLRKLREFGSLPECPTCKSEITPELISKLVDPATEAYNTKAEASKNAIDERKALGNPEEADKQVKDHEQAKKDLAAAQGRIKDDRTILNDAESKLDSLTNSTSGSAGVSADEEIAELRRKIELGTEAVNSARKAVELKKSIETATEKQKVLLDQQKKVEGLVKFFGEEIMARLLNQHLAPFVEAVNNVLIEWNYRAEISIEPYVFAISFLDSDQMWHSIPLKHLSKSQRYRFALAFQIALAVQSGFRFIVVDEADIYDPTTREGLAAALDNADLDQAIVMATDLRTGVPTPEEMPNAIFWRLDDVAAQGMIPTTKATRLLPAA